MSRGIPLLLAVALLGCGKTVPAPSSPSPTGDEMPHDIALASESPALAAEPAPSAGPFHLRWAAQGEPYGEALAVASDGHVAVITKGKLAIRDGRGNLLTEGPLCDALAATFLGPQKLLVICDRALSVWRMPQLERQRYVPLPEATRAAAFASAHLAVGFADGVVRLYEMPSLEMVDAFRANEPVAALALSRDGQWLAAGLDSGELVIRDRDADDLTRHQVKVGLPVSGLSLASDDQRLFVVAGPLAEIWSRKERRPERRFATISSVAAAEWLDDGTLASVGRDGLLLLDPETGAARSLGGGVTSAQPGSALGVDAAGRRFCVLEPDGRLACYGRGGAANRQIVSPIPGGVAETSTTGRVVHHRDDALEVRAHAEAPLPDKGTLVRVFRYRQVRVSGAQSIRWIETTEGEVEGVQGDVVEVRIGQIRNHEGFDSPLTNELPVKLVWLPARRPEGGPDDQGAELNPDPDEPSPQP